MSSFSCITGFAGQRCQQAELRSGCAVDERPQIGPAAATVAKASRNEAWIAGRDLTACLCAANQRFEHAENAGDQIIVPDAREIGQPRYDFETFAGRNAVIFRDHSGDRQQSAGAHHLGRTALGTSPRGWTCASYPSGTIHAATSNA
jgi:hypothetical protein